MASTLVQGETEVVYNIMSDTEIIHAFAY